MRLPAQLFDGKTSAARAAEVELLDAGVVQIQAGTDTQRHLLATLQISQRIGNTPRRLQLPGGALCILTDNDAIDAWLHACGAHSTEHRVFRLERHWGYALVALTCVVIGTLGFIRYGVPKLAETIANQLPTSVDDRLGSGTLAVMDQQFFSPSKLAAEQQQAIRDSFARIIANLPDRQRYRLEFRQGGKLIGANAFALPSGTLVMTDELVALSEDPNELTAVLAHEVGHVEHRHALRATLQSSASALVMLGLFGDVSSISSLTASMPALLTQAKYSRIHETEADDYAVQWLTSQGIATHYFGDLLTRLEQQHRQQDDADQKASDAGSVLSYFSSHPRTQDRAQRAEQATSQKSAAD